MIRPTFSTAVTLMTIVNFGDHQNEFQFTDPNTPHEPEAGSGIPELQHADSPSPCPTGPITGMSPKSQIITVPLRRCRSLNHGDFITGSNKHEGTRQLHQSADSPLEGVSTVRRPAAMASRSQATPHGVVSLTSRWKRDRYYLCVTGAKSAVSWLFPSTDPESVSLGSCRHTFAPSSIPVTSIRDLQSICSVWQAKWSEKHQEQKELKSIGGSSVSDESPTTLREVYDFHQRHLAPELSLNTQAKYPFHMRHWFRLLGTDVALSDLNHEKLLDARMSLRDAKTHEDSTINGMFSTLRKMLNLALAKGWLSRDYWSQIEDINVVRNPTRYWTREEVGRAFQAAAADDSPAVATLMLVLGVHLGLRKNEAVNLRWCDLDLDRIHPTTKQHMPVCRVQERDDFRTKTYQNRMIPISQEACRLLRLYRNAGSTFVLEHQRTDVPKHGGTKRVYRYDTARVWSRVLKEAMKQGVKRITYHEMRSTFASLCLQAGESAERVARWLGHKDTRMLRDHYAHLIEYDQSPGLSFLPDSVSDTPKTGARTVDIDAEKPV